MAVEWKKRIITGVIAIPTLILLAIYKASLVLLLHFSLFLTLYEFYGILFKIIASTTVKINQTFLEEMFKPIVHFSL